MKLVKLSCKQIYQLSPTQPSKTDHIIYLPCKTSWEQCYPNLNVAVVLWDLAEIYSVYLNKVNVSDHLKKKYTNKNI